MANTYVKIAEYICASNQASIVFNSIPSTYTDLMLLMSAKDTGTGIVYAIKAAYNSPGTTSSKIVYGAGSGSPASANQTWLRAGGTVGTFANANNTFASSSFYIPNYAGSTAKSGSSDEVTEANQTDSYQVMSATLDTKTSAISSITLTSESGGSFVTYSTFYLYGISKS
jgi:hypothetical protein